MRKRLSGFNNNYDNVISSIGTNSYDSSTNSNEISSVADNDDDNNNITMSSSTVHVSDGFSDNPGSVNEVDGINSILPSSDQTDEIDQTEGAGAGRTTKGKAAILVCIINLLNTVAGTGMLGLPAAYAGAGFVTGSILLFVASFFSIMGLRLLAISAKTVHGNNGIASFYSVASAAVPQFSFFIDAAVAIKGFGVATSYFITVGDCMSDSFRYILRSASSSSSSSNADDSLGDQADSASILTSRHFWVVLALLLVLPISFFKTLSALKYTSSFSLVLILSLAVIIIMFAEGIFDPCQTNYLDYGDAYEYKQQNQNDEAQRLMEYYQNPNDDGTDFDDDTCRGDTYLVNNFDSTIKNISIFIFSFACQQNVFTIVNELKNATQTRIDIVLVTAIGAALVLYLFVAVEGYRTYGSEVKGDLLLNYPQTGLVTMMRMAIAIMVILSYPLQLDPSRRCLTTLINSEQKRRQRHIHEEHHQNNDHEEEEEMFYSLAGNEAGQDNEQVLSVNTGIEESNIQQQTVQQQNGKDFIFYGITCSFLLLSFVVAMSVSDLGVILGVVGATGSTTVSFILPGAVYIKLHPHPHLLKNFAYLQLVLGVVIVPIALYFVLFRGGSG